MFKCKAFSLRNEEISGDETAGTEGALEEEDLRSQIGAATCGAGDVRGYDYDNLGIISEGN